MIAGESAGLSASKRAWAVVDLVRARNDGAGEVLSAIVIAVTLRVAAAFRCDTKHYIKVIRAACAYDRLVVRTVYSRSPGAT